MRSMPVHMSVPSTIHSPFDLGEPVSQCGTTVGADNPIQSLLRKFEVYDEPHRHLAEHCIKSFASLRVDSSPSFKTDRAFREGMDLIKEVEALLKGTKRPSSEFGFSPSPHLHGEPGNTTVFVGGINRNFTVELLKALFRPFGEFWSVNLPCHSRGKGEMETSCGFIHYMERESAEKAIELMQGFDVMGCRLRTAWGKSSGTILTLELERTKADECRQLHRGNFGWRTCRHMASYVIAHRRPWPWSSKLQSSSIHRQRRPSSTLCSVLAVVTCTISGKREWSEVSSHTDGQ